MSTLNGTLVSLLDWAKRKDPNGKVADVVELLNQTNDLLEDMPYQEGNLETGHQYTVRTGLPSVYWRIINQGVPSSKSTTAQAEDKCGMLEARTQVDEALAEMNGNTAEFMMSETRPFAEALNQEMTQTLFYGNAGLAPEEFTGLAPRYSAISGATNASHVLNGGGTGSDNASIWLVGFGDVGVYGIFPKGSKAGVKHNDLGVQDAFDGSNNRYRAYMQHWVWKNAVCVKDWRYAVRIANIDISNLVAKSSAADLPELMIKAIHRIPFPKLVSLRWYMNRTCLEMLDIQLRDDVSAGGQLKYEMVDGKPVMSFRGIPIRLSDQLLETEATVS